MNLFETILGGATDTSKIQIVCDKCSKPYFETVKAIKAGWKTCDKCEIKEDGISDD